MPTPLDITDTLGVNNTRPNHFLHDTSIGYPSICGSYSVGVFVAASPFSDGVAQHVFGGRVYGSEKARHTMYGTIYSRNRPPRGGFSGRDTHCHSPNWTRRPQPSPERRL